MKIIKYIFGFFLAIVVIFSQYSCNDNAFLEENPSTFYTIENIFSTSEQVDQVLISNYKLLRDLCIPQDNGWVMNLRGRGTDMYDVPNIRSGDSFSNYSVINTTHGTFNEIYSNWFYMVARANLALYAAELPEITWAQESDKIYTLAQARFFRAFAYKNLGELFGGVPIVTEITKTPRYDYERATRVATYQFAIDEMEAILNDLPETTPAGGRIVRGVAQHNLSELYLAMGTQLAAESKNNEAQAAFAKSINYANQLIDGSTYKLITERFGTRKNEETFIITIYENGQDPTPTNDTAVDTILLNANYFWDIFQEGNVNYQAGNPECIWAVQVNLDAHIAGDGSARIGHPRTYGPIFRDGISEISLGVREDVGGRGVSFTNITMYTRDIIYEGKFSDDMRNSDAVFRRRFKGNVSPTATNPAPYYCKIIPWEVIYGRSDNPTTNDNTRSMVYPISCKIATDKFSGLDRGQNMSNLFRDDYMIRLAETILLRAEAKQRSGNKAGAAADINILRDRAQCSYRVTEADIDDNFDLILDERARELVYEEWRWNTLLRMGGTIAVDRIRKYAYWPLTASTLTFNYNLWPIPQSVIDTNKDVKMEQNPGWENR